MEVAKVVANRDEGLEKKGYPAALACRHFAAGEYSQTVDLCLQLMEKDPECLSARALMARSLYHVGDLERAREQFQAILTYDPNHLVALKYLGDICFRAGQQVAAMSYYRRVLEIDPCCGGLNWPLGQIEEDTTRKITIKRLQETAVPGRKEPLTEPVFITETVGDIYRDQGYYRLAGDVYRRLLSGSDNNRIAGKLKEVETKLGEKD